MVKPKRWSDVYPQGTKEGDEEAIFFRSLARHPKFAYRSGPQLVKETGLTRERIEEIIDKYTKYNPPIILPHPTNDDHWGYWERCEDQLKSDPKSLCDKDHENRIKTHSNQTGPGCAEDAEEKEADEIPIPQTISEIIVTLPDGLDYVSHPVNAAPTICSTSGQPIDCTMGDLGMLTIQFPNMEGQGSISWEFPPQGYTITFDSAWEFRK